MSDICKISGRSAYFDKTDKLDLFSSNVPYALIILQNVIKRSCSECDITASSKISERSAYFDKSNKVEINCFVQNDVSF